MGFPDTVPCSFPNARIDPEKVIAPIKVPILISIKLQEQDLEDAKSLIDTNKTEIAEREGTVKGFSFMDKNAKIPKP